MAAVCAPNSAYPASSFNEPGCGGNTALVEHAPRVDSQQIPSYMGKNTPERKDYIMENLVVTVEEGGIAPSTQVLARRVT